MPLYGFGATGMLSAIGVSTEASGLVAPWWMAQLIWWLIRALGWLAMLPCSQDFTALPSLSSPRVESCSLIVISLSLVGVRYSRWISPVAEVQVRTVLAAGGGTDSPAATVAQLRAPPCLVPCRGSAAAVAVLLPTVAVCKAFAMWAICFACCCCVAAILFRWVSHA